MGLDLEVRGEWLVVVIGRWAYRETYFGSLRLDLAWLSGQYLGVRREMLRASMETYRHGQEIRELYPW